jgi:hypothetical protein
MKRKIYTSKRLALLVTLTMVGVAVPAHAADFFPLDVWEMMGTWQPNPVAVYLTMAKANRRPMSMEPNRVDDKVPPSFPFDVWKELNDLGGIDANRINAFVIGYGRSGESEPNPYWLPEELNTP